jgi:CHAT domain-containing protein/predicted negative regulator of RcsB-dependent stress response
MRALAIRKKLFGDDSAQVASTLNNLAVLYEFTGKFNEADVLFKRSLEINRKIFGEKSNEVARNLFNLSDVYRRQHKFAEAEQYCRQSIAILQELSGRELELAQVMQSLARQYSEEGKFAQAEPILKQTLAVEERIYGKDVPNIALVLQDLADLCRDQKRYNMAEPLLQRSLKINEEAYGPDHPDVASNISGLADVFENQGKFTEAESLYRRALEIEEKVFDPGHLRINFALSNLAEFYTRQGRLSESEPLLLGALAISEKAFGPNAAAVAQDLDALARLRIEQAAYADAEDFANRAIRILDHVKYDLYLPLCCFGHRAIARWHLGSRDEAISDLQRSFEFAELMRANSSGGEQERAELFGQFSSAFELMIGWQTELGDVSEAQAAAERSRARTLVDQLNLQGTDLLAGVAAEEAKRLRERDTSARAEVASLEKQLEILPERQDYSAAQKQSEYARLTAALTAARERAIEAYRDVRNASPAYRLMVGQDFKPVALDQLQGWVTEQDALFLQYFLGDEAGYLFIVPADGEARVVKLEISAEHSQDLGTEAGPLTAERMKAALLIEGQELPQRIADKQGHADPLFTSRLAALWKLLIPAAEREALTGDKYQRLIVVPDSAMANLPFEALVVEGGEDPVYLLDRGPPVLAGPSATLLYNLAQRSGDNAPQSVLTVGNPQYSPPASSATGQRGSASRNASALLAGFEPGTRYAARGHLQPLPFTGWEVSWVNEAFTKIGATVSKLLQKEATEAKVRSGIGGRSVVHLACHGLVDQEYGNFFGALALTPGSAAANDDGYLTLPEIYELPLKDCELAILSACQTNYGPEQRGEGVWALSRGFLVAGSRRVVASNWLVDDEAAASLIYVFCNKLAQQQQTAAENGPDHAQALHYAKRWVRKQEKWKSPYFWATFTLIGPK